MTSSSHIAVSCRVEARADDKREVAFLGVDERVTCSARRTTWLPRIAGHSICVFDASHASARRRCTLHRRLTGPRRCFQPTQPPDRTDYGVNPAGG